MQVERITGAPAITAEGWPAAGVPLPAMLAVAAARQAVTPTSIAQRRLAAVRPPFDAAFARPVAEALAEWGA